MTDNFRSARLRIDGRHGWAEVTDTGALSRLELDGLSMIQYPASELEHGSAGLWLRVYDGATVSDVVPLLGAGSGAIAQLVGSAVVVRGSRVGIAWEATLRLADEEPGWVWQVVVATQRASTVDLVSAVDPALAPYGAVRTNEYYVSQYLDLSPVGVGEGTALAVRQNMPGPRAPWLLVGSDRPVVGWATDSAQLVDGQDPLGGLHRLLPSARLQHEHSLAVLSSAPVTLAPGETYRCAWFGLLSPDHPAATGDDDSRLAQAALTWPEVAARTEPTIAPVTYDSGSLFSSAPLLAAKDLAVQELERLAGPMTVVEERDGRWWSAVGPEGEAFASAAKERAVLRPHGHILRTGSALTPDPDSLTCTVWMAGTFGSQVTRGHAGRSPLVSTARGYLGLHRAHGIRVFVDTGSGWRLLGVPSAWQLSPSRARWYYAYEGGSVSVTTTADTERDALAYEVETSGTGTRILLAAQLADGTDDGQEPARTQLDLTPDSASITLDTGDLRLSWSAADVDDDAALFRDGRTRGLPWLTLAATGSLRLMVSAVGDESPGSDLWADLRERLSLGLGNGDLAGEVSDLSQVVPWFAHNAVIHFLSPRGLEQYSGGAWGTRDVCQGPVGLLLALGYPKELRDTVLRILAGQLRAGTWPQAFEFSGPQPWHADSSHGDVVYWPLLATGEYLLATGDTSLAAASVGFVDDDLSNSVTGHLELALDAIEASFVTGHALPAYGHGDWNDSLQPADPTLAARMVSTWTAVLQVHALRTLAAGLEASTTGAELADRARRIADQTERELGDLLLADDLLAGYGVFDDEGKLTELLVHPRDSRTGLHYGVLPWIHAVSADLLSPDQAAHHLATIRAHLWGPDGARLFDRPAPYRGGPMSVFQRAEAATFWGREIGLMYTHAHLRYAEALARYGDAAGLFEALGLAHPRGITRRVPSARPRQDTCYYSSSDAVFADRYDAEARYDKALRGEVELEGGWRIYSSGPGLFLRLVVECLLGVRRRGDRVELDPVLDPRLDGLAATVMIGDRLRTVRYAVSGTGSGVTGVTSGGRAVESTPLHNPYRAPGVVVQVADLGDDLEITVGS